jgi:DNA-binding GntR family transcriptional regulator
VSTGWITSHAACQTWDAAREGEPMSKTRGLAISHSEGRLAAAAYEQVKARILTGAIRPGDVIVAQQVAAQLKVSRTPAHEALKRLVQEGYLVSQPRIGYTVTPVNLDELRDLFQVRIRLECLAAELAAAAFTDEHAVAFAEAERHARAVGKRLGTRPPSDPQVIETSAQLHRRFHEMISDVSGNRRLTALIGTLQDETQRFWALLPDWPSAQLMFLDEPGHQEIYDAIVSKDPEAARSAVAQHMRDGLRQIVSTLLPPEPPPMEEL